MTTGTRLRFLDAALGLAGAGLIAGCVGAPWWFSGALWGGFLVALIIGCDFRWKYRREGE